MEGAAGGPPGRGVALVLTDPERTAEGPAEHVARLFQLSPAESKLARLLAMGRSLAEAAEELGVTQNTARTVVKRVFARTGTRSQRDLVRLLVTSATGLASARTGPHPSRRRG